MKPIVRPIIVGAALAWLALAWPAAAAPAPESFAPLVEELSPAVVNISTTQKLQTAMQGLPQMPEIPEGSPLEEFRDFFERFGAPFGNGGGMGEEVNSLGSGFVIDPEGYIVTNNHVIAEAEQITVTFSDNTKAEAEIVGRDPKTDLALLKVETKKPLHAVRFGDSDAARVGDWVLAIGNPFGFGGTVTAGIISARARDINAGPFDDFLQTDAAINRGNSGGPMFNAKGEVIGISTAIFSPSGGSVGIGFAVPSALAEPVIRQLREFGHPRRGWLGVKIQSVTEEIAESIGMDKPEGALVVEVTPGSPAAKAGLKEGDVITAFDGKDVPEMRKLPRMVAESAINKRAEITYFRNGETHETTLTLGEMEEKEAEAPKASRVKKDKAASETVLGMDLVAVDEETRQHYGLSEGARGLLVVGIDRDSPVIERGIREGDVIAYAGDKAISSAGDLRAALEAARKEGRKSALLRVVRNGETVFVAAPSEEGKG